MLKNYTSIDVTIDGKLFQLFCEQGVSTVLCKEALFQYQKIIGHIEDNARAQQEANEAKEEPQQEFIADLQESV
jgi:hypothetical protein